MCCSFLWTVFCVVGSFRLYGLLKVHVDCVKCCRFLWSVLCVIGYPVDCVMC